MKLPGYQIKDIGGFPYVTLNERDTAETSYGVVIYPASDTLVLLPNGDLSSQSKISSVNFSVPSVVKDVQRLYEVHADPFSFHSFAERLRDMSPENDDLVNRVLSSLAPSLFLDLAVAERDLFESGRVIIGGDEVHRTVRIRPNTVGGYARI